MATRLELQTLLEELLGSRHVYYQSPENVKMEYPAIRYKLGKILTDRANNAVYLKKKRYEIIVIAKKPDHPAIEKLLELKYCSYDRRYISDGLYHDVLTLYY